MITPYLSPDLPGPRFVQLFEPILVALRELGGSAQPTEVRDQVAENLGLSDEDRAEALPSGGSRFDNMVNWARFYLARSGFLDSSRRGVWTLTEQGRSAHFASHDAAYATYLQVDGQFREANTTTQEPSAADETAPPEQVIGHRAELLSVLQSLTPAGFERFCQRLLRECGFQEVDVTGRSGDGGIDGNGVMEVNPLVSFKVLFQCKRYQGSVGCPQVRDFRGAMMGRADKGIILTTGHFTAEAKKEAVRDGVPPIELVDGEKLLDMLENLELGLEPVRAFRVDLDFFEEYRR